MKYGEIQDSLGQYTPQKKVHTNGLTLSVPSVNRKMPFIQRVGLS